MAKTREPMDFVLASITCTSLFEFVRKANRNVTLHRYSNNNCNNGSCAVVLSASEYNSWLVQIEINFPDRLIHFLVLI